MRITTIIFVFVSIFAIPVIAQTSQPIASQNNRFTFPESIVCGSYGANGEIVINTTALECDGDPPCVIDFNYSAAEGFGNKPDPTNPGAFVSDPDNIRLFQDGQPISYTFTQPGKYEIAILIGAGVNNFDQLVQSVTVLPSTPPEFDIYNCASREVRIEITDQTFPLYVVDYDQDNITDVQTTGGMVTPTHTYGAGETQGIISVAADYLGCTKNTKSTQLVPGAFTNDHEISRLEVTDSNEIPLTLRNTGENIPYVVERGVNGFAAFTVAGQISNTEAFTDSGINPDQNYYCYRAGARDVCNNQTFYSNVICSHDVSLSINDHANAFGWQTNLSGAASLTLLRDGTSINPGFTNSGTYNDNQVACGSDYCYRMITDYGGNIQSISKTLCGRAISSQPPIPVSEVTAVVDGNSVHLEWVPPPLFNVQSFDIFRIPTNMALPFQSTTETTLIDNTYQPFNGICYEIRFDDVCGNRSARSHTVCPIELKSTLNPDNSVLLSWSEYNGWSSGASLYTIEKFDANGSLISSTGNGTSTTFTDNTASEGQTFSYRILATPVAPGTPQPSVSNIATVIKSVSLWHPNAFIPGAASDERNRAFAVKGVKEYITSYELRIFNRWGELMFHSNDMDNEWDGTYKGVTMPEGTYIFKTKVVDTAGRTFDYSGAVVLLRK